MSAQDIDREIGRLNVSRDAEDWAGEVDQTTPEGRILLAAVSRGAELGTLPLVPVDAGVFAEICSLARLYHAEDRLERAGRIIVYGDLGDDPSIWLLCLPDLEDRA